MHSRHDIRSGHVGLVGRSFIGFESVGWFGYFGFPTSARPWQNQILWNWSAKCNSNIQINWECGILYAIFGYQVGLLACLSLTVGVLSEALVQQCSTHTLEARVIRHM